MRLTVRVPATAANLGPGFDALALALGLHNEVVCETAAEPAVEVSGEGAGELAEDASNLIVRAMAYFAREAGGSLPSLRLRCRNAIPLECGLGSSASAVVTGVLLADRLLRSSVDPDRLLALAVDVEGHPDNVAACFRGGAVIAYLSRDGWRAERLEPHPDLMPVVLIPQGERVPTQDARRVLPLEVPLRDAAFNLGRSALVVRALTHDPALLHEALEDRLHQARRLELAPKARALLRDLRDADVPACVSGAGPTILAFEGVGGPIPELGPGWRVERPGVAAEGASIVDGA
jgi:homoserine kinase